MPQSLLAAPPHVLAAGLLRSGFRAVLLLLIIGEFIVAIICALVARMKGYSAVLFAVLGFLFSIIALIVVLLIPRRRRR